MKATSTPEVPDREQSQRTRIPRWTAPIIWTVGLALVHVAAPWGISLLSPRNGWVDGRPGPWNLLALILVVAGLSGIIWCASLHFVQASQGWELERTPKYLLVHGPYKFSRNPMYLSVLVIWLGWALFYRSVAVFVGLVVAWVSVTFIMAPSEERQLEARFGETYRQYKNAVPRWLGKTRR